MGKRDLSGGQRAGRGRRPMNGTPIMANPRTPTIPLGNPADPPPTPYDGSGRNSPTPEMMPGPMIDEPGDPTIMPFGDAPTNNSSPDFLAGQTPGIDIRKLMAKTRY